MFSFYAEERAGDVETNEDGDMLLFQWGVYWSAKVGGKTFQLDITRQFIRRGEYEPYQLGLTFHFIPGDAQVRLAAGNRWCDAPGALEEFKQFVLSSDALHAVGSDEPVRVDLRFEEC